MKRLNCICDVYVNRHGKVNVRSIDRRPPTHGFLFGRTQWNPDYTMNGLPVFQGVSGVCVKIHSHTSPNQMTSLHTFITTLDQGFRKLQL